MSSRMLCTLPQEGKASLKLFLDYAPEDELPPIPSVSSLEQLTSPTSLSLMQLPETSNLSELSLHELEMRQSALHEQQRQLNRAEIGITSHMEALGLDATNVSTDVSSSSGAKAKGQKFVWQRGRLLGKGSNSKVYIGMNSKTAELFAVKQISDPANTGQWKALEKEINLMKELSHPNIVRYLGTECSNKRLNIFLECVPGGSIASLLKVFGVFHEKVAWLYTRQILQGLKYLHDNGVIHRDIKGANILVDNHGTVKLADFGCSRRIGKDDSNSNNVQGTTLWMAPEVLARGAYSRSSDVWSMGCTIVEMTSGRPPWDDLGFEDELQAAHYIANTTHHPPIPHCLSPPAVDLLRQCFAAGPTDRASSLQLQGHPWIMGSAEAHPSHDWAPADPAPNARPLPLSLSHSHNFRRVSGDDSYQPSSMHSSEFTDGESERTGTWGSGGYALSFLSGPVSGPAQPPDAGRDGLFRYGSGLRRSISVVSIHSAHVGEDALLESSRSSSEVLATPRAGVAVASAEAVCDPAVIIDYLRSHGVPCMPPSPDAGKRVMSPGALPPPPPPPPPELPPLDLKRDLTGTPKTDTPAARGGPRWSSAQRQGRYTAKKGGKIMQAMKRKASGTKHRASGTAKGMKPRVEAIAFNLDGSPTTGV